MRQDLVEAFYQDLRFYLKQNNCISVDSNQLYTVKLIELRLQESISTICYVDSCQTGEYYGPTIYDEVHLSSLSYTSQTRVTSHHGEILDGFIEIDYRKERKCGRDNCNKPRVFGIRRNADRMRIRSAKLHRKRISKVIHEHWLANHQ